MVRNRMLKKFLEKVRYQKDLRHYIMYSTFFIGIMFLIYMFNLLPYAKTGAQSEFTSSVCPALEFSHRSLQQKLCHYDPIYPLSSPEVTESGIEYKIAVIADLDEERSKVFDQEYTWKSYLKTGYLLKSSNGYSIRWVDTQTITTQINEKGRGLELSELCVFNKKLYSVDDRTGIIYQIKNGKAIPWLILMDGDGETDKGFKSEWMTVKDGVLFVGGLGKEWTSKTGEFINYNPLFVKSIDSLGGVTHHNWTLNFLKIREAVGITFPGYMVHEAVMWSSKNKRWFFLPRRMSKLKYDDKSDEHRGTNVLISCKEDFTDINVVHVGELDQTHGFSSFKFIPGTNQKEILALKTKEVDGNISTYIMIFDIQGNIIMPEMQFASDKFEGVEFI
ncbi:soluble calcium-activated nucleotidase 1 [Hydra vulgaris]|nr:soluble calcium-activated nucleotidase 1-like [Hydra vulgaris]